MAQTKKYQAVNIKKSLLVAVIALAAAITASTQEAMANGRALRAIMETPLGRLIYTTPAGEESLAGALRAIETRFPRVAGTTGVEAGGIADASYNRFRSVLSELDADELRQVSRMDEVRSLEDGYSRVFNDLKSKRLIQNRADELSEAATRRARVRTREWFRVEPLDFTGSVSSGARAQAPRSYSQRIRDFMRGATADELATMNRQRAELSRIYGEDELNDTVAYLMRKWELKSPAEIYERLHRHNLTLKDVMYRAEYGLPMRRGASMRERFYQQIVWGLQDRQLANPDYLRTMAIALTVEITATAIMEPLAFYSQGQTLSENMDKFVADMITFTLAEIVLGWVTAPRMSSALIARNAAPTNFGRAAKYSIFARNAAILGGTGFGLGLVGNGSVELYRALREEGDPANPESAAERFQRVLWRAALTGIYMGTSSNIRYMGVQRLIVWMKNRGFPAHQRLRESLYFGLYLVNTGVGTYKFDFYRNWMEGLAQWVGEVVSAETGLPVAVDPASRIQSTDLPEGMIPPLMDVPQPNYSSAPSAE